MTEQQADTTINVILLCFIIGVIFVACYYAGKYHARISNEIKEIKKKKHEVDNV